HVCEFADLGDAFALGLVSDGMHVIEAGCVGRAVRPGTITNGELQAEVAAQWDEAAKNDGIADRPGSDYDGRNNSDDDALAKDVASFIRSPEELDGEEQNRREQEIRTEQAANAEKEPARRNRAAA